MELEEIESKDWEKDYEDMSLQWWVRDFENLPVDEGDDGVPSEKLAISDA